MSTNSYNIGDDVTISGEFESSNVDTDPTTLHFIYQKPDGTEVDLLYGTDAEVEKDDTGKYHVTLLPATSGLWRYRWEASGNIDAIFPSAFYVWPGFPSIHDRFATVELMAAYLAMTIDKADILALAALDGATSAIRKYCDQHLSLVEDDVVIVDGTGSDILLLPEVPVVSVSEVLENCDMDSPRTLTAPGNGSSSEYDVSDSGLLIRRHGLITYTSAGTASYGTWPNRRRSVQVTYTHGFTEVPSEVQLVCVAIAARTFAQDGAAQEGTGSYNVSYAGQPATITDAEKRILDRYRSRRR